MIPQPTRVVNVDVDFESHPKARVVRAMLGRNWDLATIRLFLYAGKFCPDDGVLRGLPDSVIEEILQWDGERGAAIKALTAAGYLKKDGDGNYYIHDWLVHNGHISKIRTKMEGMRRARAEKTLGKSLHKSLSKSLDKSLAKALNENPKTGHALRVEPKNLVQKSCQEPCQESSQEPYQEPCQEPCQGSIVVVVKQQQQKKGSSQERTPLSSSEKFSFRKFSEAERASGNGNGTGALEAPPPIFVETCWLKARLDVWSDKLEKTRLLLIPNEQHWTLRALMAFWNCILSMDYWTVVEKNFRTPVAKPEKFPERLQQMQDAVTDFYATLADQNIEKVQSSRWMRNCLREWTEKLIAEGTVTSEQVEEFCAKF